MEKGETNLPIMDRVRGFREALGHPDGGKGHLARFSQQLQEWCESAEEQDIAFIYNLLVDNLVMAMNATSESEVREATGGILSFILDDARSLLRYEADPELTEETSLEAFQSVLSMERQFSEIARLEGVHTRLMDSLMAANIALVQSDTDMRFSRYVGETHYLENLAFARLRMERGSAHIN